MRGWLQRGVWEPVAWYVGIALLVPLLNGAAAREGFWSHASVVLVVAGLLAVAAAALRLAGGAVSRKERRVGPRRARPLWSAAVRTGRHARRGPRG